MLDFWDSEAGDSNPKGGLRTERASPPLENLFQLQEELRSGAYRPGPYSNFSSASREG